MLLFLGKSDVPGCFIIFLVGAAVRFPAKDPFRFPPVRHATFVRYHMHEDLLRASFEEL